jgi:hypothetical protein
MHLAPRLAIIQSLTIICGLLQQVKQLETALEVQRGFASKANDAHMQCERQLFESDKSLNRFAETLDDVVLARDTIAALDEQK